MANPKKSNWMEPARIKHLSQVADSILAKKSIKHQVTGENF
jgi:hypothetical protein